MRKIIFILFILPFCLKAQFIVGDSLSPFVIYKNIKDTIITIAPQGTKFCSLDLDGDNVNDVKFRISQSYSPGHLWENQSVRSLNGFQFVTLLAPVKYLDTLSIGSSISNNLNWYSTSDSVNLFNYSSMGGSTYITGIYLRQNSYVGFRKIDLADTLYGWMLLDAGLNSGIKIRSWAYSCNNFPSLTVTLSSNSICASESATLSASGASSYSWSTGSTNASIVVAPSVTTSYTVQGNANGCSASSVITQSVNSAPSLTVSSSSNSICALESVTITATGTNTYTWSTGNTNPDIVVNPGVTTSYTVAGSDSNGCSTSAVITQAVDPCVGINEYNLNKIKIYPNPAVNLLQISDETHTFKNAKIEIINYLGQRVLVQNYSEAVDVSILPTGIYTLKIVSLDKEAFYSKFIRE